MWLIYGCSIEFSRVQVPEKYDQSVLPPDKNDAYIKYRDGFAERAPYQTAYNDMSFLHNKVHLPLYKYVFSLKEVFPGHLSCFVL